MLQKWTDKIIQKLNGDVIGGLLRHIGLNEKEYVNIIHDAENQLNDIEEDQYEMRLIELCWKYFSMYTKIHWWK